MQRAGKIAAITASAVLTLAAVAYFGQFAYLRTGSARQLAQSKIGDMLGGSVRVSELGGGIGSTHLSIEIGGAPGEPPLVAGQVKVDVSPLGLAVGNEPQTVRLDQTTVNLTLDKDNNIVGRLPQPAGGAGGGKVPDIVVTGAKVHIRQEGKPDFYAEGIDLILRSRDGKLTATGNIRDPRLGTWTLNGEFALADSTGSVTAKTDAPVALAPDTLKAIPFVPKETWETVELNGTSNVAVRIGHGAGDTWNWRVQCDPTNTLLKVFPIDLAVAETSGSVTVEGAVVTLKNVRGKAAGGTLAADGVLNFDKTPSELELKVVAGNLDVKQTPKTWKIDHYVDEGRLDGQADITLVLAEGRIQPRGEGRAKIVGKSFGGKAEVDVRLTGDGERLRFTDDPGPRAAIPPAGVFVGVPPSGGLGFARRQEDRLKADLRQTQAAIFLALLLQPPSAPAKPAEEPLIPEYVQANLKLTDVDLEELLKRGNIATPVKLAGKVSLRIKAEIPTGNLRGIKFYVAEGTVSSPSLQIEGLTLKNVRSEVRLKDGVLTLTELSAEFPPTAPGEPAGRFLGTARFGIDPRTELAAKLELTAIPLDQVVAALPGYAGKAEGPLSGQLEFSMPAEKLGDLNTLVANGKLTSPGLTLFGQRIEKLALELAAKGGTAQLTVGAIEIYKGTISGTAKLPLADAAKNGTFDIAFKDLNADAVTKAIPDSPVKLSGNLTGTLAGTLPPFQGFDPGKIDANLNLNSPRLVVQGIPTSKLTGKIGYKKQAIAYDLKGDALGGNFDVNGTYPLRSAGEGKAPAKPDDGGTIRLQGLRLNRLATDLRIASLQPLRGVVNLTMRYTYGDDGLSGSGRLEVRDFGWRDDAPTSDITSDIRIADDRVEIPSINGDFAGGRLGGRVRYDLDNGRRSFATMKLENADAAQLLPALGLASAEGRLSATFRTSLGKEFRGAGLVTAGRTRIEGVAVTDIRIPYTFAKVPGGGARIAVGDARATVANGRVTAKADVDWNDTARVDGRIEFVDVNVGELAQANGTSARGIGKTTGRFDFNGGNVRSADDLKGTLTAVFGEATTQEIPILGSVGPLLSPQSLGRFDNGDLVARLGAGQLRIERLALAGSTNKLFADGNIGLNGGLDLNVVYNTGQIGPSAPVLRGVLRNVPAIGPVPVALIVRVTEALSNRVVRLKVGGTVSRPVASVNAAGLLTENAIRFFAGQYAPLPAATR
jgi:hypothetical protein